MEHEITSNPGDFSKLITIIDDARSRALKAVNAELIQMYWDVGACLSDLCAQSEFGDGIIDQVASFIARENPNIKGFNRRGLYRMKQFYEAYRGDEFVSPLVTQISWTNHLLILSGCKSREERHFYLDLCAREQYSKRELERQINSAYFERYMLSRTKPISQRVPGDVRDSILDTYVLEFLDLPDVFSERNLRKAIIANLKQFILGQHRTIWQEAPAWIFGSIQSLENEGILYVFLVFQTEEVGQKDGCGSQTQLRGVALEFGKDFTLVGEEYRVQVGNTDFFIDLLFYNRALSCLVPIELKLGKFRPEHIGQINFYLEALDRDVRKPNENPSVGVILCASKDDAVVEYALSRSISPTLVSDYQLCLPDKQLLQNKLRELTELALENGESDESFC